MDLREDSGEPEALVAHQEALEDRDSEGATVILLKLFQVNVQQTLKRKKLNFVQERVRQI